MTSERIKDKFEQKALKGLWNGNLVPIGYKKVNKKLIADKRSSKVIKDLYEIFIETGSFKKVMDHARKIKLKHPQRNNLISENGIFKILRNPVYLGKIIWHGKVMPGIHEPIISKELFDEAQERTKDKGKKKALHKKYLLARLVKCAVCGSSMTNTFTNKKKRRYYYYKCIKVVKQGKGACSIKQVNSEKLEIFITENLERISKDQNYIESLAFKWLRNAPLSGGFEPLEQSEKHYTNRIVQVLQGYASDYKKGSQLEKSLVLKRTIEKIIFSRNSLEVIVSLEDKTEINVGTVLAERLGGVHRGIREGIVNSDAPACISSSILNGGGEKRIRTSEPLRVIRFRGGRDRPLCHLS